MLLLRILAFAPLLGAEVLNSRNSSVVPFTPMVASGFESVAFFISEAAFLRGPFFAEYSALRLVHKGGLRLFGGGVYGVL